MTSECASGPRSTQAVLRPGLIRVDYEVSLSELTLTQELRGLIGHLPGAGRDDWLAAYARETGPLNARGFLIQVAGTEIPLRFTGHDLTVEEHPRYVFHFLGEIPPSGRLRVDDTNFASSEGTSRLAIAGQGVRVEGDALPATVEQIPIRPRWQLSDEEEARTHRVVVDYQTEGLTAQPRPSEPRSQRPGSGKPASSSSQLSYLLDAFRSWPPAVLVLLAFGFGALHGLQPGHGKTLMLAAALQSGSTWRRAALLAGATTAVHVGSVMLVAGGLWATSTLRFGDIHVPLARAAGLLLAGVGLFRLGRILGGFPSHDTSGHVAVGVGRGGILAMGLAGGIVPCWDAVALLLLGEAVGRLGQAFLLVLAFSVGLGAMLLLLGSLAARLHRAVVGSTGERWDRRFATLGGVALTGIGVYLLAITG
ncbi:MAG: ABC transporter permease [Isosphaeraceae bacterium]